MIPLRDVIPSRTTPWVTLSLIAINLGVFLFELTLSDEQMARFAATYGLVPAQFTWAAVVTSMFVHAGLMHVGSNLLSLWIFGDNVEDRLGHGRYLIFYLLTGAAAALAETWAAPLSSVPIVGASGAIAGVMGAYIVMFPHSRVLVLVFLIFFIDVVEIPAYFFLGLWFALQVLGGVGRAADASSGGIAFWAHVAGFLTGVAFVWVFKRPERERADWWAA